MVWLLVFLLSVVMYIENILDCILSGYNDPIWRLDRKYVNLMSWRFVYIAVGIVSLFIYLV